MRHVISCLVENQSGVLARIAGMFSCRGFNIDSLTVGETIDPTVSRITVVSHGDDKVIEQIIKQLRKLIDVIRVLDLSETSHLERELALVKVAAEKEHRSEVMQIASVFGARIADVDKDTMIIEVVASPPKVDALIDLLKEFGIPECARTGSVALRRGNQALRV
jgi:acetolactate synthase-1/3 small subunit